MIDDIRFALRALVNRPGFAAVCVLTLALGIGATTAIFSVVNGVMLRPLPYADDSELAVLWYNNEQEGIERDVTSYPTFQDWRATSSFRAAAGFVPTVATFTGERPAEEYAGAWVTGEFFGVLGVRPAHGDWLADVHARPGDDRVLVLSHRGRNAWFGDDEAVMGRRLVVNGVSREIIGVMPAGFSYPTGADFWLPMVPDAEPWSGIVGQREAYWLSVIGRLSTGSTIETATAELDAVMARLQAEELVFPGDRVFVEPLRDTIVGDVRPAMAALAGAVAFVLLIACANIANLMLARGTSRRREFAVRSALGASGGMLARQALVESVVLAILGGVAGLAIAYAGTAALVSFSPPELPRVENVRVDLAVIGFAIVAAMITGLGFGLAPAWQARSAGIAPALRDGDRSSTSDGLSRLRPGLVVLEVALALVLLIGAGLMLRSFAVLQGVDPGFRTQNVLSFRVAMPSAHYPDADQLRVFQAGLFDQLQSIPGVEAVSATTSLLLPRLPTMSPVTIEGRPPPADNEPGISVTRDFVHGNFFRTLDIPLLRGRSFGPADTQDSMPVVVVNETFARRLMSGEDPIGRRFTRGDPSDPDAVWQTIVGVVADTRRAGLAEPVRPEAYRPISQVPPRSLEVLLRTAVPPLSVVPTVRALLGELDPNMAIAELRTVEAAFAEAMATRRFVMMLLSGFAVLAVTLAAIGLYGVLAYLIAQRRREIGLRMALGAGAPAVIAMVLRQSLRYVLPGVVLGTLVALSLTRVLQGQLHGISATDPLTFASVVALLVGVALLASWLPARRASRIDPMAALRSE
jgi:putative ABC transport system permease protein